MKIIFKKSHLPFLKRVVREGEGRECWTLARMMQERDGLQHQLPAELALLGRGAARGDAWATCELARNYFFHCGDLFLPQALSLWKRAILQNDGGAKADVTALPIHDRILAYRAAGESTYESAEMQLALLTEWHLTRLGLDRWATLQEQERRLRCEALLADACRVLELPAVELVLVPQLSFNGGLVDGLAQWEGRISLRAEVQDDLDRLVEVLFHELGHIAAFEILRGGARADALKRLLGISEERVRSWQQNEMGYEVPTSEEDPDTLSYGVWLLWATFFGDAGA